MCWLSSVIEHALWPLVVLVIFFFLRGELAALISHLKIFKAGSIEVRVGEGIREQGFSKDQLKAIRTLSSDELDIFMVVSFSDHPSFTYTTGIVPDVFKQRLLRLQEAGLLRINNPEDPGTNIRHSLTPLGRRLRALLIDSSARLLREVA